MSNQKTTEKYDFVAFEKEQIPYAVFNNGIVNSIRDADALGLYAYLSSCNALQTSHDNYSFLVCNLAHHFHCSKTKIQRKLQYLINLNLFEVK